MESDDDEIPPADVLGRGALSHRIRMRNNSVLAISVYDIRGKNAVVQSKDEYVDITVDPITGMPDKNKIDVAAHYGLNEEFVYSTPEKDSVVLHDNKDMLIFFIHFHMNQEEPSAFPFPNFAPLQFAHSRNSVGCIGLAPDTSVGSLKSVICDDKLFNKDKYPCLFFKGKRCDEDSVMVSSLFTNGDVIACYAKSDVTVQCFHMARLNVEHKYEFACFTTDNVWEMKQAFKKSFCSVFPRLASGVDDVWFSVAKQLLEDEEYFFLNHQRRRPLPPVRRLVLHVKQANSFPITLKTNSQEQLSQILLISTPVTTAELREEVSLLIKQPPNALHLYTKNKKLKEIVLSESVGIHPNCVVVVKVAKKIQVLVSLNSAASQRLPVQLFKLDPVLRLKEILGEHIYVTVSKLQLFFNQNELENERLVQDYRIREDDIIVAYVFSKPELIKVRQPGREPLHLTIDGLQYTTGRLKQYLANALGCSCTMINLIHSGRCLQDDDTLEQSGLESGSTVLIPRLVTQDQLSNERILEVYVPQEDSSFRIAFAKEAGGILFYAPESVQSDCFEKHTVKTIAQDEDFRRGIMLQRRRKDTRPESSNPNPVQKKKLIHQHDSRPLTSRFDALAKGVSSCTLQSLRKHPQHLLHAPPHDTGYHSHPESRPVKRYMYLNELRETDERYIFRQESTLDVCKSNADEVFSHVAHTPECVLSPEKGMSGSPEHVVHSFPSLQSPVEAIQDSVLRAVSKDLGNDWKHVALELGLEHRDIEEIEYRYSSHLREQAWQALILWKKRKSRNATIASLKKALSDCGLTLTADSIDESIKYESV